MNNMLQLLQDTLIAMSVGNELNPIQTARLSELEAEARAQDSYLFLMMRERLQEAIEVLEVEAGWE